MGDNRKNKYDGGFNEANVGWNGMNPSQIANLLLDRRLTINLADKDPRFISNLQPTEQDIGAIRQIMSRANEGQTDPYIGYNNELNPQKSFGTAGIRPYIVDQYNPQVIQDLYNEMVLRKQNNIEDILPSAITSSMGIKRGK